LERERSKLGINNVKVIFSSPHNLELSEKTIIKPAKYFISEEFKKMPYSLDDKDLMQTKKTAKSCPSFVEILREGYVIPSPCDIYLYYNKEIDVWKWQTPTGYGWVDVSIHQPSQFQDYYESSNVKYVFKINSLWNVYTPKGYSVRQIPMLYHNNKDFQAAYGVIKSDVFHQINTQILFTSDKDEIIIEKGTPLCYIVPYKRENYNYKVVPYNKMKEKDYKATLNVMGKFSNSYQKNAN